MIDITGLDKAAVLAALYNHSRPIGLGILQAIPGDMSVEEARRVLTAGDDLSRMVPALTGRGLMYFDYLFGRPLKINLSGDEFDPYGYDRDNGGPGTAARIIDSLRVLEKAS